MLMRSKGKRRTNLPLRGGKRTKFVGSHKATENFVRRFPVERRRRQKGCISNRRSLVCMFSPRAKGAVFRFYRKRRPPIFQGSHHRCEAAYKNCGKAATTTPPPLVLRTTFPPASGGTLNPPAKGRSILRTLAFTNPRAAFAVPDTFPYSSVLYMQRAMMELRRDIHFLLSGAFLIRGRGKGENFS